MEYLTTLLQLSSKNLFGRILLIYFICNNSFAADSQIIKFDDLQNGPDLVSKLYAKGLVFPYKPYIYKKDNSHIALMTADPQSEFNQGPLTIEFRSLKSKVQFVGGALSAPNTTATLKAFDATGRLIATDGPKNVDNDFPHTQFKIEVQNPIIKKIEFEIPGTDFEIIDDLLTEGSSNENLPPPTSPTVNIASCKIISESYNSQAKLIITGTVSGDQLGPTVRINIDYKHSPSDFSGPTSATVNLIKNQQKQYAFSFQQINPSLGPLTISIVAQNLAGIQATETVDISNIYEGVTSHLDDLSRSDRNFNAGHFLWAIKGGLNDLYVYEHIAISTNKVIKLNSKQIAHNLNDVREPILQKYITTVDTYNKLKLGFPLSGQVIIPDGHGGNIGHIQNFQEGTIYETSSGLYYVPVVFVKAIDLLVSHDYSAGGKKIGFPIMDPIYPTGSIRNNYTWLFQKFAPLVSGGLPTTIEIKGQHPKLFVERQGGGKDTYFQSYVPSIAFAIPTIYDEFNCDGIYGPCSVSFTSANKLTNGRRFCKDQTSYEEKFNALSDSKTKKAALVLLGVTNLGVGYIPLSAIKNYLGTEWPSVLGNDNTLVSLSGIVTESKRATADFPFSHPNHTDPCPISPSIIPGVAGHISGSDLMKLAGIYIGGDAKVICPSDYNIHVSPLKNYENVMGEHQPDVEVEVEDYYFRPFYFAHVYLEPSAGDLVFTAGRWVIDCGHSDFNTEIHPPAILAYMRGEKYNNKDATVAIVWVNNYYTGQEISFNIYPPPRPTPTSKLVVASEKETPFKITIDEGAPLNYLQIKISSVQKHISPVGDFGDLIWTLGGGTFRGKYHVYWEE